MDGSDHTTDSAAVVLTPRDAARRLILKDLGLARVAAWCGVAESTVYQWLHRGTDARPIPERNAMLIFRAATRAGIQIDLFVLIPGFPGRS